MKKEFNMDVSNFLKFDINHDDVKNYQVVFFPENYKNAEDTNELQDAINSIDLYKALKSKDVICGTIEDFGISVEMIDRWSEDKWFGTVYVRDKFILPVVTGVIAGVLSTTIIPQEAEEKIIDRPKVHIEIVIENDSTLSSIKYDGDGDTFIKMLEGIKGE